MPTETLRPNGVGAYSGNTPVGDTPNWECCDDVTPDELATRVETISPGAVGWVLDTYQAPDSGYSDWNVLKVTIWVRARKSSSEPVQPTARTCIRTHSLQYYSSELTLSTSWGNFSKEYVNNPNTSQPWSISEVNDLQIGVSLKGGIDQGQDAGWAQCTQVYAIVDYTMLRTFTATVGLVAGAVLRDIWKTFEVALGLVSKGIRGFGKSYSAMIGVVSSIWKTRGVFKTLYPGLLGILGTVAFDAKHELEEMLTTAAGLVSSLMRTGGVSRSALVTIGLVTNIKKGISRAISISVGLVSIRVVSWVQVIITTLGLFVLRQRGLLQVISVTIGIALVREALVVHLRTLRTSVSLVNSFARKIIIQRSLEALSGLSPIFSRYFTTVYAIAVGLTSTFARRINSVKIISVLLGFATTLGRATTFIRVRTAQIGIAPLGEFLYIYVKTFIIRLGQVVTRSIETGKVRLLIAKCGLGLAFRYLVHSAGFKSLVFDRVAYTISFWYGFKSLVFNRVVHAVKYLGREIIFRKE